MPPALQAARGTVSFNTILSQIVTRISVGVAVSEASIRVVASPDADMGTYLSEEGIVLRVRPGQPQVLSGGDRHALFVDRVVDVFVLTLNLRDPGGRTDAGVAAHILREEAVVDALHMQPPAGFLAAETDTPIFITIKWVPGGQEIFRQAKADSGLLVSVLPFTCTYRQRMTVYRD